MPDRHHLQTRLDHLAGEYGVVAATAGVLVGDEVEVVATGVVRKGSTVPVTTESAFLIASITKVWTATLVMQLVDEGLVDLDAPVAAYLDPPLRLHDDETARTVTVAQLLCHAGGFLGDAEEPGFRDDDAVARIVDSYADLVQLHRPGALFSYSNSGYIVLGRVVECVTGSTWDEALKTRLVEPLGLTGASTLPEETMTRPLAVGHTTAGPTSSELVPVSAWHDPRGSGPCGGTLATTAADLLAFAHFHLRDGLTSSGQRLMSTEAVRDMREPHIAQPDPATSRAWGWGWAIESLDPRIVGHIGSACGQQSRLIVLPDAAMAICVLATGDVQGMVDDLVAELLDATIGLSLPSTPEPVHDDVDVAPFVGTYWFSDEATIDVAAVPGGLQATFTTSGKWADFHGDFTTPMTYAGGTTFLMTMPPLTKPVTATFVREGNGKGPATHLASQLRLAPRMPDPSHQGPGAVR